MLPPKKEAFWLPIVYALIAGAFGFIAGRAFAKLWFAPDDLIDVCGLAFAGMLATVFYMGGLVFWLGIVRQYYIPTQPAATVDEVQEEEDTGERWVGDAFNKEFFFNPVTDLQLYRFAMGITEDGDTTYRRWCQEQDSPFNSEQYLALRAWLRDRGYSRPTKNGEIEMTETGLAFMNKICVGHIHYPSELRDPARVHSEQFART
jgi:hypothetical protein